jgi:hypothetical protein
VYLLAPASEEDVLHWPREVLCACSTTYSKNISWTSLIIFPTAGHGSWALYGMNCLGPSWVGFSYEDEGRIQSPKRCFKQKREFSIMFKKSIIVKMTKLLYYVIFSSFQLLPLSEVKILNTPFWNIRRLYYSVKARFKERNCILLCVWNIRLLMSRVAADWRKQRVLLHLNKVEVAVFRHLVPVIEVGIWHKSVWLLPLKHSCPFMKSLWVSVTLFKIQSCRSSILLKY